MSFSFLAMLCFVGRPPGNLLLPFVTTFSHSTTLIIVMNLLKDYESDDELTNNDDLKVISSKRIPNTNWEIVMTNNNFEFYLNSKTNSTQWEIPSLPDDLLYNLLDENQEEDIKQDEINNRIQLLKDDHINQLDNQQKLLSYFTLNKINPFINWDDLIIDSPLSITEQKLVFDEYCHSISPLSATLPTTSQSTTLPTSQSTTLPTSQSTTLPTSQSTTLPTIPTTLPTSQSTTLPTTSISQSTMDSMENNFYSLLSEIPGNKINKHTTWFDARRRLETMTPKDPRYTILKSDKLRNKLFIQYQKQLN
jgi:hypothetical protein